MRKIVIIGAGKVGATLANLLYHDIEAEIILIDVIEGLADKIAGAYRDVARTTTNGYASSNGDSYGHIRGSNTLDDIDNADLVIHTAGVSRKPGMDRMDLLLTNATIAISVARRVKESAAKAHVIAVANPLDIITYVFHKITGFDSKKIVGMAGVLDSARLSLFLGQDLELNPQQVKTQVLGGHGDAMLSVIEHNSMAGFSPTIFYSPGELAEKIERARYGGAELVDLYKEGSAYIAPAASIYHMVKTLITGRRSIIPASVYVEGGIYGEGLCIGLPIVYGNEGVARIFDLPLDELSQNHSQHSIRLVREGIDTIAHLLDEKSE